MGPGLTAVRGWYAEPAAAARSATLSVRIGPPPSGDLCVTLDGDPLELAVGTLLVVDAIDGLLD